MMSKPKILIFVSYYLPGFKAGGPIRSIANLVELFAQEYEFLIVTRDRDSGDAAPYEQACENTWVATRSTKIRYLSKEQFNLFFLRRLICEVEPDILYLNSFLDPYLTVKPLLLRYCGLLPRRMNVIVAPRGEFAEGALRLKPLKKKVFLYIVKRWNLYSNVIWQASSEFEAADIKRYFGCRADISIVVNNANIQIEPDLPSGPSKILNMEPKRAGQLRVICVARIARNKNIDGVLRILKDVSAQVEFSLYGPREDQAYWHECVQIMKTLPPNIKAVYHGQVPHQDISAALCQHDLFFLPTQGENFGHAIVEALSCGLPILISNMTPWRDLECAGAGWDLPLDEPAAFSRVLEKCAQMRAEEFSLFSERALAYAARIVKNSKSVSSTRELFQRSLRQENNDV